MLQLDRDSHLALYEQIYQYFKSAIETGRLTAGARLPSVRALAAENGISKITVEQAYIQLATEGYIMAHNRAPYEVAKIPLAENFGAAYRAVRETFADRGEGSHTLVGETNLFTENNLSPAIRYNFATGAMDPEGFDFNRWKRLLSHVLRQPDRLMGYGQEAGEPELRLALAEYLQQARGVRATAADIIVSSGTQSMGHIVASLLRKLGYRRIAMDGRLVSVVGRIFEDHGFYLTVIPQQDIYLCERLREEKIELYYCMPSHEDSRGTIMSIGRRQQLLQWAEATQGYIVEDDYDSELRYYGKPIISLQGLDRAERVLYLGTPSKVLPPSIRLSYMVLPPALADHFREQAKVYRQSAGVMEQLTLAAYMQSGEWNKQIRRLRKHYSEKSKYMAKLLGMYVGHLGTIQRPEGGVYIALQLKANYNGEFLRQQAREARCDVKLDRQENVILLSFSAIPTADLEKAVQCLAAAWKGR